MHATTLLAASPAPPVVASSLAQPSSSTIDDQPLSPHPIHLVPQTEIDAFKLYVSTIPLSFADTSPPVGGRILTSEAEVRSFLQSAVSYVVWPVILAMAPHSATATRGYDQAFGSEHHLAVNTRPHDAILKLFVDQGVNMSEPLLVIEFPALDFCMPCGSSGEGVMDVVARRRLAKYAIQGNVSTLIMMDNVYAVYVHFHNVRDENAPMEILVATLNTEGKYERMTVRELVVFAAWKVLQERGLGLRSYRGSEKPPVEYRNAADGTRSYQKSGKPLAEYRNELDYSDFGDGPRAVRQTRSDRGKPITHRFHPHNSLESADAAISAHDLTTIDKSTPPRRPANLFLVTPARPIYFEASVSMITDNIGFLSATAPTTPPVLHNLIVKFLAPDECASELAAYYKLKTLQGTTIPFCYGLYTSSVTKGHVLLLENVPDAPPTLYDQVVTHLQ